MNIFQLLILKKIQKKIQLLIIYTTSINEKLTTSNPIKQTTEPIITITTNENKEPTTEHSVPVITTTINKATQEVIKTIIPTTINQTPQLIIPNSTIIYSKENIIQTTEVINYSMVFSLVLIGFSHFVNLVSKVTFNVYFTWLNGPFYSKRLRFPVEIESNRFLRILETYHAVCESNDEEAKEKISYSCEIETQIENIKSFKFIEDFNFEVNAKVDYSPLAENYKDKIQEVEDNFNNLINSSIYILDHSKITAAEKQHLNISGYINDPKPKFGKINITLMVFTKNETEKVELDCNITDIINNNYIISCGKEIENNNYNLQNAISFIEDEVLIVNFDKGANSNISFEEENEYYRYGFSKKQEI